MIRMTRLPEEVARLLALVETQRRYYQEIVASIPVGRYGKPEEYGAVATFLASQQASYLTGSIIRVDGGFIQSI